MGKKALMYKKETKTRRGCLPVKEKLKEAHGFISVMLDSTALEFVVIVIVMQNRAHFHNTLSGGFLMGWMILWRRLIFNQLESNYFLTFYNTCGEMLLMSSPDFYWQEFVNS